MTLSRLSDILFTLGRRDSRLLLAVLRAVPLRALHAMRRPGFQATVRRARRAPAYRDGLAGVDPARVRGPEDLGDFFLTSDVLKARPESVLCGEAELAIESSGTSGHVTRVYLSRRELEYSARQANLLFALHGIGRKDRLLSTLDLAWGLGSLLVERGIRYTDAFAMVVGRVDPQDAYDRLRTYRFNVLVSDPFWLARLTEIARERGRPAPMKLLVGGGEGVTTHVRAELQRFWDAPLCMTYASTEAATVLGFECPGGQGYHINEFDFAVEIPHPDAAGYGEVVFSTINRSVMPLLRYRTGDIARWLPGPCACGLPFRRLSAIRGRVDEQVSCAWGNVHPEFFAALLADVPGLGRDWQVALHERDLVPVVQFRLEPDGSSAPDDVATAVLAALERTYPDAWRAYRQGLVDVEVTCSPPGTLRRRRKLLRLVDERGARPSPWAGPPLATARG
jgi:phenylacetate-coenzyme A ligase PaaK-like adenylate-forming protein